MSEELIASALHAYLASNFHKGKAKRDFFQLEGFDEITYIGLLARINADSDTLVSNPVTIRTTAPIGGYEQYVVEVDKAATWYRNYVQPNHILILILNKGTSDAQSLQDIFLVNQTKLATTGIKYLFNTIFKDYSLSSEDVQILDRFIRHFRKAVFEPQLSNLVEFLKAVRQFLTEYHVSTVQEAIGLSLPYLEMFRYQKLAQELTASRIETLLREIYQASRKGTEVLDNRERSMYFERLERFRFDDDTAFGKLSSSEKNDLLRRFLSGEVTDRNERLLIFELDWEEVKNVLSKKTVPKQADQLKKLAKDIEGAFLQQELHFAGLPEYVQDIIQDLRNGKNADNEQVIALVREYQDLLEKRLRNQLQGLIKASGRNYPDFIVAVTTLAVELLMQLQDTLDDEMFLHIASLPIENDKGGEKEREAIAVFKALYGGIEKIMPSIHWDFNELRKVAVDEAYYLFDPTIGTGTEKEREDDKEFKVNLRFRITVHNAKNPDEIKSLKREPVDFAWQYNSDSPAATTLANLRAEKKRLLGPSSLLSIPIYNTCTATEDVRDLDLQHPRHSLGAWYEKPTDLRTVLLNQLEGRSSKENLSKVKQALEKLEIVWRDFIENSDLQGILNSNLDEVLEAYDHLLNVIASSWSGRNAASYGYRVITQAWIVSPTGQITHNLWAVIPFLHPLKLLWWRERARRFDAFIADLLDPATQTSIVDQTLFRRELTALYGSSGFPAIIAYLAQSGWPGYFLPVNEVDGYELYRLSSGAAETYGVDPDRIEELEGEEDEAQRAADAIARVVQDYIETYPFIRDGCEIVLLQCRNTALPQMLVEQLTQKAERRNWSIELSVIVHTEDRGAPLFQRMSDWLSMNEKLTEHKEEAYFPTITLKVLECDYEALYRHVEANKGMDIVILTDLFAEKGQTIESDLSDEAPEDIPIPGYLPIYHAQQEPFEREENNRIVLLNQTPYPSSVRHFYNIQFAAQKRSPIKPEKLALFRKMFGLQEWETVLTRLHKDFNWVVCYDTSVDRYLLEYTFRHTIQVIRYSLGLGAKRTHNLTVSSSNHAQDVVIRRLTARLDSLLTGTPYSYTFRQQVAQCLVDEAKQVSGDIVLHAAGPGAYLNELIGLVAAKHITEQYYLVEHPGALTTWIYLDDFPHWFSGKKPDLLFVAIPAECTEQLFLHLEVLETKCVGKDSFDGEMQDARRQTVQGINRLARAWMPQTPHLDADYWYDQLYRAVVGNISVEPEQKQQWQAFRDHILRDKRDFELDLSGHSWVFCHDSSQIVPADQIHQDGTFRLPTSDAPQSVLMYHHYGRAGLREALLELVKKKLQIEIPLDIKSQESEEAQKYADSNSVSNEYDISQKTVEIKQNMVSEPLENKTLNAAEAVDPVWLRSKVSDLERVLRQYSIHIYPVEIALADVGPSIVRFKLRLYPGEQLIKLQRITNDLARELALTATPIIGNVLGTNYVGIDLPRPKPEVVSLLPLLRRLTPPRLGELPIIIGLTPDGQTVIEDLADFPHLLVAGATNSGKSVFLRSLILCLLTQYAPTDLRLLIVDPKRTDFSFFNGLPYLIDKKVITDKGEARDMLLELVHDEMLRRQGVMADRSMRVKEFNQRFPNEALPPIVAIIDEYAQLVSIMSKQERDAFERDLMNLAAVARATGIHLVLATQRPSADVVTGTLKANLPASVAFKVASIVNSRIVIDQGGAENLLGRGDMLFKRPNGDLLRLQAPFVDEISIQSYLTNLKSKLR